MALIALASLAVAAPALADAPEDAVTGVANSSNWFSGELFSQTGENCSTAIIGDPYTEIMVQGIAGFGGAPSNAAPTVGAPYWTEFTISVPGNPCGPGSSFVATDLILPNNTVVDTTRQIRCFGLPRSASNWEDLTNQSWSLQGVGTGPYCVHGASPSIYQSNALSFGGRLIASGQIFKIFVPVKSSATAVGISSSPPDGFYWLSNATGVYANPGLSRAYSAVFPAASGAGPQVFFERPGAVPFWKNNPTPAGTESRVEFFANLYTAGKTGTFCPTLTRTDNSTTVWTCNDFKTQGGWKDAITSGDLLKVTATGDALGPNGGYAPVAFDQVGERDKPMRITWTFTPSTGSPVSGSADFRTLAGPDPDGDGIPNDGTDQCPATKGTLANGCLPGVQSDPDGDGVFGGQDLCPTQNGTGFLNGCPGGVVPTPPAQASGLPPGGLPPTVKALTGASGLKSNALLKRAGLGKGLAVKVTCSRDSSAALSLAVSTKVAKKLKLKVRRGAKSLVIATGSGACKAAGGGTVKLKLGSAVKRKVLKAKSRVVATLTLRLTAPGATPATSATSVKVG